MSNGNVLDAPGPNIDTCNILNPDCISTSWYCLCADSDNHTTYNFCHVCNDQKYSWLLSYMSGN